MRPRRSVLYMPAANERALEKAKSLPADCIIFDLEDAVAPDAKESARSAACAAAGSGAVRPARTDDSLQRARHAVGCPPIWRRSPSRPRQPWSFPRSVPSRTSTKCPHSLDDAAAPEAMTVWAMIETPTAVLDVRAIAAHPRVVGAGDGHQRSRPRTALLRWLAGRRALLPHLATAVARCTRSRQGDPRWSLQRRQGSRRVRRGVRAGRRVRASTARR